MCSLSEYCQPQTRLPCRIPHDVAPGDMATYIACACSTQLFVACTQDFKTNQACADMKPD